MTSHVLPVFERVLPIYGEDDLLHPMVNSVNYSRRNKYDLKSFFVLDFVKKSIKLIACLFVCFRSVHCDLLPAQHAHE